MAFESEASNLVQDDTNGVGDIFVHDVQAGLTTRVSVASNGAQGTSKSECPSISADGRYVAFWSDAAGLVPGDTNGWSDVFVHDRQTGQTRRASVASNGTQDDGPSGSAAISGDGRYVAFASIATNLVPDTSPPMGHVFVHDTQTGTTSLVSLPSGGARGNDGGNWPAISADGRYVAFVSNATNLVPGDTNDAMDVFIHDRLNGWTIRVSVASDGTQANSRRFGDGSSTPTISGDGRYVGFTSDATNLVAGDTNGFADIFVRDRGSDALAALHLPVVVKGASVGW